MALYPPIVASSMPAFNIEEEQVRIYYTLSDYNIKNMEEIATVQVTARAQSSNKNVLRNGEIIEKTDIEFENSTNRYYITLTNNDIAFEVNTLYKIQLRFSNKINNTNTINFFTDSTDNCSEWSTVCIIKPIYAPLFYLDEFHTEDTEEGYEIEEDENFFTSNIADFVGIYDPSNSSETLKYWRIRLLNSNFDIEDLANIDLYVLSDSGIQSVSANNYTLDSTTLALECSLNYELQLTSSIDTLDTGPNYKVYFEITTKNGYNSGILYNFTYTPQRINALEGTLKAFVNEEEGYIKLDFEGLETNYLGNLVLRRSDSKGKFCNWTDLKNFEVFGNGSFTYYDFTAESGTFYRYLVQKRDSRGRRGTPVYDQTKNADIGIFAEWLHPFLLESTGNGNLAGTTQLKLKYDFQISSYKTNIGESKTDTLGSQYPYIRRNGNLYYRSFPISGTITEYMDEASLLTDTTLMFDGYYNYYTNFKGPEIDKYVNRYDYIYERKFREKVELFLYNAKPKLYKSTQEGNIFIKLMLVSLTPKTLLGRLVYSFSATAYEIDKADIDTYNQYQLIDVGLYNPNVYDTDTVLSRLSARSSLEDLIAQPFKAGVDIIGAGIASAASHNILSAIDYNIVKNGQIISDYSIDWLRIEIDDEATPPYRIIKNKTTSLYEPYIPTSVDDIGLVADILYQQEEGFEQLPEIYLGWLFTINGLQIIISPPNNIYEIKEDSFKIAIKSIIPAVDTVMDVDYQVTRRKENDPNTTPKKISIKQVNGQLIGTYNTNTDIIANIAYKYHHSFTEGKDRIEKRCNGVQSILVDTEPGTVISLRTATMFSSADFVVNETGLLYFEPGLSDKYITSMKFKGKRFYLDLLVLDNKPINGHYYFNTNINGWMFYYKSQWYCSNATDFYPLVLTIYNAGLLNNIYTNTNPSGNKPVAFDIPNPVSAMVFYLAAIRRDVY